MMNFCLMALLAPAFSYSVRHFFTTLCLMGPKCMSLESGIPTNYPSSSLRVGVGVRRRDQEGVCGTQQHLHGRLQQGWVGAAGDSSPHGRLHQDRLRDGGDHDACVPVHLPAQEGGEDQAARALEQVGGAGQSLHPGGHRPQQVHGLRRRHFRGVRHRGQTYHHSGSPVH